MAQIAPAAAATQAPAHPVASSAGIRRLPKVRQACDACHDRKTRCNGENPCSNCKTSGFTCTYLAVPKKKGPKGARKPRNLTLSKEQRNNIIETSRGAEPRRQPPVTSADSTPGGSEDDSTSVAVRSRSSISVAGCRIYSSDSRVFHPSMSLSPDVIQRCVEFYYTRKYPIWPILPRNRINNAISQMSTNAEMYSMIVALCAAIISSQQPDPKPGSPPATFDGLPISCPSSDDLVKEANRARQFCDYTETPSLFTVHTSFFLFGALFNLDKHNSAWFHLREAITLIQTLRFHDETTYLLPSMAADAIWARRMFWLLFITERAYALQQHRPLTLQRTIELPVITADEAESGILSGFLDLVSLFKDFDDTFLALWNATQIDPDKANSSALLSLQSTLKSAVPNVSQRAEVQQADLLVSRQWLKTMVWQLCVSKGLLSSSSYDESMSFTYPITIARDVVLVSRSLPTHAFEPHGIGILEKVFDIGCCLADVLQVNPGLTNGPFGWNVGPEEYLVEILRILDTVLGGDSRYLNLLSTRVNECLGSSIPSNRLNPAYGGSAIISSRGRETVGWVEELEADSDVKSVSTSSAVGSFGGIQSGEFWTADLARHTSPWLAPAG